MWFGVLRDDVDLIEGGQGAAVRQRTVARLDQHVARVFESACRDHAALLARDGEFASDMIIGRWWRGTGPWRSMCSGSPETGQAC